MELLRRRFGTKRVHGNVVYQEYIANKEHTHMNATQWETLTDFVKWLGKEGWCLIIHLEYNLKLPGLIISTIIRYRAYFGFNRPVHLACYTDPSKSIG